MQALATAVFPVFLLILLGLLLRQRGWLADGFWEPAARLCDFVLRPALLLTSLAQADFAALAAAAVTGAVVLAIMAMTCLLLLVQLATRGDGPAFTAVLQTAIRPNTYIGLSIPFALYGEAGLAVAALDVAAVVPTVHRLGSAPVRTPVTNAHL